MPAAISPSRTPGAKSGSAHWRSASISDCGRKRSDAITVDRSVLYPTLGPEHRFNTILFIEKEGFDPLFAAEHLAERYDLAIMSTKGMSVTAARLLLDRLAARGIEQILVLHDFDISGFSIFGTLGTSGRRYRFNNQDQR